MELINGKKLLFYFLLYFSLINCNKFKRKKEKLFKCNSDKLEPKPIKAKNFIPISKSIKDKRHLDSEGFKDFNIYLDLFNFNHEVELYNIENYRKEIFIQGMKKAVETIKTLLKVKAPTTNFLLSDEDIKQFSIKYWNKSNIGSEMKSLNKGTADSGIDLFIFVRFGNNSEMGENTLASAGARFVNPYTGQPIIGVANINRDIDYSIQNSLQFFQATILHEFIHILGFANYFFTTYYKSNFTRIDNYGVKRVYLSSQKLLQVAKKYFNCENIDGIELEEYGGDGTTGSHWEERILLGDIMNGIVYPEEQVLSEFTLAVLEDSGYYKANYYTGGLMQYGKNKGCDFLNEKCVINRDGKVNDKFKNEFYSKPLHYSYIDPGCSSGRQSRAYHGFYDYGSDIPLEYQYYSETNLGGRPSTDYCPVSQEYYLEAENLYFVGHCSTKGNGEYGSLIDYFDTSYNNNGDLVQKTGEFHSDHSFCVLSSLISKNIQDYVQFSRTVNAFCYQMYCSDESLTIQINDDYLVCPRSGGKIKAINYEGYLLCPDYYLICSGTELCNDLFDCVEKKSLLKDNIIYEYVSKTSQDLNDADDEEFSEDGYELSTNGKCPKDCIQCNSLGYCIKCKSDCGIAELIEEEMAKRVCLLLTTLETGYYKNEENSIYYKCLDNCLSCENGEECLDCETNYLLQNKKCLKIVEHCETYNDNGNCIKCVIGYKVKGSDNTCERGSEGCIDFNELTNICNQCEENYRLSNNLCYKKISNCLEYGENELCSKCKDDFAFKGNDRENCYKKETFGEEYYTKDGGISYFKCDDLNYEGIGNCTKCSYDNNLICEKCQIIYVLKDEETNKCYLKSEHTGKKYYEVDNYHINTCSKTINNCEECQKMEDNTIICTKCEDDYRLSNNMCYKSVENCLEYDTDEKCSKCKIGFAFKEDNREICENRMYLEEYYSKDNDISYYKCDDTDNGGISNCNTCQFDYDSNKVICNKCSYDFVLKDSETDRCYQNSDFQGNNQYYYEDQNHVKTCSKSITHCKRCEKSNDDLNCIQCETNYFVFNDIKSHCEKITSITNIDEYYKVDDIYYLCLKYNNIENCQKCEDEDSCNLCNNEFTFIDDEKLICKNITELGRHYIIDGTDSTIYRKCDTFIDKCDTCLAETFCSSCISGYGLFYDKKSCIEISEKKHYKDEDELYYPCNTEVENCEICSGKNKCLKCEENYVKLNSNQENCNLLSSLNLEEYYIDPNDDNNYIKCSNYVNNCYSCNYPEGCVSCKEGFIMLNENKKSCHEKSKTDLTGYFTNDEMTYYSCKDVKYKNNLQCFSLIPNKNISLTFLQVQIVEKKLFCYMITHSPIPKNFCLKLKIRVYKNNVRILDTSEERIIILRTSDDSNGSKNTIITFTSTDVYGEDEDVEVQSIDFNGDSVTKEVTDNNYCSLKFDTSSKLKDTGKAKTLISNAQVPDCSSNDINNIVNLNMDKVMNCEFNLNSDKKISYSKDNLDIELVEAQNNQSIITAQCDTKKKSSKSIKCTIGKGEKEEINNEYSFKEEIIFDSNKYILISSEESFKIFCDKKDSKIKTMTVIIIIGCVLVIAIIITITTIIICKKDKKEKIEQNEKNNKKFERLPTKDRYHRRKTAIMNEKIDTDSPMNDVSNFKRINVRNKTRNHTKKINND